MKNNTEKNRISANKYKAQKIFSETDISSIKLTVKNKSRREKCKESLELFILTYFSDEFFLPLSQDHKEQLALAQGIIKNGGRLVLAAPRGSGKTSMIARACLWALLYNYRKYLVVLCSDESKAQNLLGIIKADILGNGLLAQDFPEICKVITYGKGTRQRLKRLHKKGKPLNIEWGPDLVRFPELGKDAANGQTIQTSGLTGSIRGLLSSSADGEIIRPDLVLLDDPQTDASARSPSQTGERESLICGAVSGLAGPLTQIAMFGLVTVIKRNDLAERLLDNSLHPEFNGKKYKLVYEWPKSEKWDTYKQLWRDEGKITAQKYYEANRSEMDEGAKVGWEHRIRQGEISAIQTAFNLKLETGFAFDSEYQNEPSSNIVAGYDISPDDVSSHVSTFKLGVIPDDASLVIGIDINLYGLHWTALGACQDGSCYICDYGKFPSSDKPIWDATSTVTEEQAIYSHVISLVALLMNRTYMNENSEQVKPSAILVDCGYKPEVIISACKTLRRQFSGIQIVPCRGFGGRYYSPKFANRNGEGWHTGPYKTGQALCINVDVWRSRAQKGFLVPVGSPGGSVALFQGSHKTYSEHVTAERITDVLTSQSGSSFYVWTTLPGAKTDYLDSLTYALAGASFVGVGFGFTEIKTEPRNVEPPKPKPEPKKLSPYRRHVLKQGGWATRW